jgi:hypothetical protein
MDMPVLIVLALCQHATEYLSRYYTMVFARQKSTCVYLPAARRAGGVSQQAARLARQADR